MNATTSRVTGRNALVGLSLALVVAVAGCGTHGSASAGPAPAGSGSSSSHLKSTDVASIRVMRTGGTHAGTTVWTIRKETARNEKLFELADSKAIREQNRIAHPDHIVCCDLAMYTLRVTYKNGKTVVTQVQGDEVHVSSVGHLVTDVMAKAKPLTVR